MKQELIPTREQHVGSDINKRARDFWADTARESVDVQRGLDILQRFGIVPGQYAGEIPDGLTLLGTTQKEAEQFLSPFIPDEPLYGALPHFSDRAGILARVPDEYAYFAQFLQTNDSSSRYMDGLIMHEAKFGEPLRHVAESILQHYPELPGRRGKHISVFGLSGSGKSFVADRLAQHFGTQAIVMDSDTVRYNLFAKKVFDVETTAGKSLTEVRSHHMHNRISFMLYAVIQHVAQVLGERGYTVIQSNLRPQEHADLVLYVEHPQGIHPQQTTDEQIDQHAQRLFECTQERISERDNYPWNTMETITKFSDMHPVSVRVPQQAHAFFLRMLRAEMDKAMSGNVLSIPNVFEPVTEKRISAMDNSLKTVLNKLEHTE